jgi:hypothetical protein
MKPKQTHTSVRRGKRVRVILRTGERFIDVFVDSDHRRIVFRNRIILVRELRSMSIAKGEGWGIPT